MFLDESTVTTTSAPDQIELRTDVSAPFMVESVSRCFLSLFSMNNC